MATSIMAFSSSFNVLCGVLYESFHELSAWHASNLGSQISNKSMQLFFFE